MNAALTLARKDLSLLFRDKVGFFFAFFFPVIYASLFGLIFAGMSGGDGQRAMRVAVVDEDQTDGSRAFVSRLKKADEIEPVMSAKAGNADVGFDRSTAAELVRKGRLPAFVVLEAGFGETAAMPFWGGPPRIRTGIDPSRRAEAGMLQGILTRYYFEGAKETLQDPERIDELVDRSLAEIAAAEDMNPVSRLALQTFLPSLKSFVRSLPGDAAGFGGFEPIQIESVERESQAGQPRSAYEITFPQGIIWGIMGCAAAFGISLVVERTNGTLTRLRTAPIGLAHILAGKAVACFVTTCGVAMLLLVFAAVVFGVRPSSIFLLIVAVISSAICFTGIMMLLSVLGKTEQSAGGIGWACLMILAMIGGGMLPLFFMPAWMQQISHASPIKWSILAMEGATFRAFSPAEMAFPCLILVGVGAVSFVIGSLVFGRMERN